MAARSRKSAPTKKGPASGKLAGKTVAFVGKFGYGNRFLERYQAFVAAAGAKVVDSEASVPDYLVAGEGRGGNPPAAVAKLQKQHPQVQVLDESGLCQLLLPMPEELAADIRSGQHGYERWDQLNEICRQTSATIDLTGVDLRKANLYGAKLECVILNEANLGKVSAEYARFGDLRGTQFDGADLPNAYFLSAEACSYRQANLTKAWLGHLPSHKTFQRCDFSGAKLPESNASECLFIECNLSDADLSDAQLGKANFSGSNLSGTNLSRAHASQGKFDGANVQGAVLFRADLRQASLVNADLRRADLREAVLTGADLTGATIDGADFAGAALAGANVAGLDASRARNFQPPVSRQAGPKLRELAQVAAASKEFETCAEVDLGKGEHAALFVVCGHRGTTPYLNARSEYRRDRNRTVDRIAAPTFEQGMLNLAERWPKGTLRLDTIRAKGCRSPRGKQLRDLLLGAWAEAFGLEASSPDALQQQKADQQAAVQTLRETMLKELKGGSAGVKKWNARSAHELTQIGSLHNLDLKGAKLDGLVIKALDLRGSNFEGASVKRGVFSSVHFEEANFAHANLEGTILQLSHCNGASFQGANLAGCSMSSTRFQGASLQGADLTGAKLPYAILLGADFTGATLDGADLTQAVYDANTKFPRGFVLPETMRLQGPPPVAESPKPSASGSMDFDTFYQRLGQRFDQSRLSKAAAMLKADRFQLFADVKDDSLVGVVKSQTDPELVYSCKLTSNGTFGCCTQNLRPCGGLQGALCKHLLVLVVGLTKAGRLDAATSDAWALASKSQKPTLDKDAMSETFIRYKGAEAGEVDWRPTETIPEDYYAL